jgi:hypothetical protein
LDCFRVADYSPGTAGTMVFTERYAPLVTSESSVSGLHVTGQQRS